MTRRIFPFYFYVQPDALHELLETDCHATQWKTTLLNGCHGDINRNYPHVKDIILLNTARSLPRAKRRVKIDFITFGDGRMNNFKIAYQKLAVACLKFKILRPKKTLIHSISHACRRLHRHRELTNTPNNTDNVNWDIYTQKWNLYHMKNNKISTKGI